jgi:hypothetical protein
VKKDFFNYKPPKWRLEHGYMSRNDYDLWRDRRRAANRSRRSKQRSKKKASEPSEPLHDDVVEFFLDEKIPDNRETINQGHSHGSPVKDSGQPNQKAKTSKPILLEVMKLVNFIKKEGVPVPDLLRNLSKLHMLYMLPENVELIFYYAFWYKAFNLKPRDFPCLTFTQAFVVIVGDTGHDFATMHKNLRPGGEFLRASQIWEEVEKDIPLVDADDFKHQLLLRKEVLDTLYEKELSYSFE